MKAINNIIIAVLLLIPVLSFSTEIGDYQSKGNVNFSSKNNWQTYNGSKWVNATTPPPLTHGTTTTVSNYAIVDVDLDVEGTLIFDETINSHGNPDINVPGNLVITNGNGLYFSGNINILSGGVYTNNGQMNFSSGTFTVSGEHIISSTGQDYFFSSVVIQSSGKITNNNVFQTYSNLTVSGSLETNGSNFYLSGNTTINNNAQVVFNQNGNSGSIPVATWNTGSTLKITGVTSTVPQNLNQNFYNLIWDCSTQSQDFNLYDALKNVNGNLTFSNTNNKNFTLFNWFSNSLTVGGNLNISGNTKVTLGGGGSSNVVLNVNGNFIQSGGILDLGNSVNTMNVKGNFTSTGGKVIKSNGSAKIIFNGNTNQVYTSSNANESLNNVSVEVANGSTLTLSGDMKVLGDANTTFTVNGYMDMANYNVINNYNFVVSGTGKLNFGSGSISTYDNTLAKFDNSNGSTLCIGSPLGITSTGSTGNVQVKGTRTFVANSKYIYNGTSGQVTGNGLPSSIYDLVISNSNGVTLSNNLTVSDSLFMTTGNIITGNYTISLTNSKPGSLSYTDGLINGKFSRAFVNSYTTAYLFPLGNSALKRSASITLQSTSGTSSGTITMQYKPGDPSGVLTPLTEGNGYVVNTYSKDGYWQTDYTGPTNVTYNMSLVDDGIPGVNVPTMLRVISRSNSTSAWALNGSHSNGSGNPITAKRNYLTFSSSTQFAVAGNTTDNPLDGSLPVELVSFTSNISNNIDVKLNWVTASEINNTGFEIQRKDDGSDYKKIGYVKGNNNTTTTSHYSFEDKSLTTGKYSYRLKQIDNNGNYEYFELNNKVEVGAPNKFSLSQNYPNPFNPTTKINFAVGVGGLVTIKVYDLTGKEVKVLVNEVKAPGFYSIDFSGANLSSGVYIYKINAKNFTDTKKMTLIK